MDGGLPARAEAPPPPLAPRTEQALGRPSFAIMGAMHPEELPQHRRTSHKQNGGERETSRLEAFSDGVFAIAITLLVLEVKVPKLEGGATSSALARALLDQWPSYLALVTSFFTLLIMWVHHHLVFRQVHRADVRLLFVNGILLLFISVTPFPTAVVAEYLGTPAAPAATR